MKETNDLMHANPKYKDSLFRALFKSKKYLLNLYNALNESDYENEEELEIVTLEYYFYIKVKNDLAFVLDSNLCLYEHQSTVNPNMPLRDLIYVAEEYHKIVSKDEKSVYSSVPMRIPMPRFIVFYNGQKTQPERQIMKLSDLYEIKDSEPALELQVLVLNINSGYNEELKEKCKILREYTQFVEKVRCYMDKNGYTLEEAINCAIDECIQEGILEEFLRSNRERATMFCINEYYAEEEMKKLIFTERSDAEEKGKLEGKLEASREMILSLLEGKGLIPEEVRNYIMSEEDETVLKKILLLAAKYDTMEQFKEKILTPNLD